MQLHAGGDGGHIKTATSLCEVAKCNEMTPTPNAAASSPFEFPLPVGNENSNTIPCVDADCEFHFAMWRANV